MAGSKENKKTNLGRTYPLVKGPDYSMKSMWLVPLEMSKLPDGAIVYKHISTNEDGSSLAVETTTPFKIGHMKLFAVLLESLWSHSKNSPKAQPLTTKSVKAALGPDYSKLPHEEKVGLTRADYQQQQLERLKEILDDGQLARFNMKKPTVKLINAKTTGFVKVMLEASDNSRTLNDGINVTVRGLLNRVGRKDHRKAQRDMLFAELRTLQNVLFTAKDGKGSWIRYGILRPMEFCAETDRIRIEFTADFLEHLANKENPMKFLSSQLRDELTAKTSLVLVEYLQLEGVSRQRDGTYGVVTVVKMDDLILILSLEDVKRPDMAINRAFKDIENACGIKYEFKKGTRTYYLTNASKKLTDHIKGEVEDAEVLE